MLKLRGGLEGSQNPSKLIPQGELCPPDERFLRRERSAAKTTGANNRYISIFAPGKSRRIFSKNCKPALRLAKRLTFYPSTLPSCSKPPDRNEAQLHFDRASAQAAYLYFSAQRRTIASIASSFESISLASAIWQRVRITLWLSFLTLKYLSPWI